jgi:hypothetical protein
MEKSKNQFIQAEVFFSSLESTFWFLKDKKNDQKYRVENIPEELKQEGLEIIAYIQIIPEEASIFMSPHTNIQLIEYNIVNQVNI